MSVTNTRVIDTFFLLFLLVGFMASQQILSASQSKRPIDIHSLHNVWHRNTLEDVCLGDKFFRHTSCPHLEIKRSRVTQVYHARLADNGRNVVDYNYGAKDRIRSISVQAWVH